MQPVIDHIQITVKNLENAEKFYDRVLPLLGFDLSRKNKGRVEKHDFDVIEYFHDNLIFGINSPRKSEAKYNVHRRRPGSLHHLAFRATNNEEVIQFSEHLKKLNVEIVEGPSYFPQHGANYFAVFFKDPDGIKLEVMFEN